MVATATFADEAGGTRYRAGAEHWSDDDRTQHEAMGLGHRRRPVGGFGGGALRREGSLLFVNKKKQKNFIHLPAAPAVRPGDQHKKS